METPAALRARAGGNGPKASCCHITAHTTQKDTETNKTNQRDTSHVSRWSESHLPMKRFEGFLDKLRRFLACPSPHDGQDQHWMHHVLLPAALQVTVGWRALTRVTPDGHKQATVNGINATTEQEQHNPTSLHFKPDQVYTEPTFSRTRAHSPSPGWGQPEKHAGHQTAASSVQQ